MNTRSTIRPALWLALRLPDFCLNVLGEQAASNVWLVSEKQRVFYLSEQALSKGAQFDMDITTAQLLCGAEALERNIELEQKNHAQLTEAMYQFTPYIEAYSSRHEYGLLLEISRCLNLFGGVKKLSEALFHYMDSTAFTYKYGLGHTAKSSWLLSYKHYPITFDTDTKEKNNKQVFINRLQQLPIELFREYPDDIEKLKKSGFYTFQDLALQINKTNISSFKKRFKPAFVQAVQAIFDIEENFQQTQLFSKPQKTYSPKVVFWESLQFDIPLSDTEQLKPALIILLDKLEQHLIKHQYETQLIEWELADIYGNKQSIVITSDYPQLRSPLFLELSYIKLEHTALSFEIDTLNLTCDKYQAIHNRDQKINFHYSLEKSSLERKNSPEQDNSLELTHTPDISIRNHSVSEQDQCENLSLTAAKLAARLGADAIYKVSYHDEILPERSHRSIDLSETSQQNLPILQYKSPRPSWLFNSPIAITVKTTGLYWQGHITLISKAERMETRWWEATTRRDYFLARREDNLYLWVFLELKTQHWFVHGLFS